MATGHATRTLILWVVVLCGIFVYVGYRIKSRNDIAGEQTPATPAPQSQTDAAGSGPDAVSITSQVVPRESPGTPPGLDAEPDAEAPDVVPQHPVDEEMPAALPVPRGLVSEEVARPSFGGNQRPVAHARAEEIEARLPVRRTPEPDTVELYKKPLGLDELPEASIEIESRGTRHHKVVRGDSLRRIAEEYFGTPDRANDIYAANRDQLASADALTIGTVLVLPTGGAATPDRRVQPPLREPASVQVSLPPGHQYTLKQGDTIRGLAEHFFAGVEIDKAAAAIVAANTVLIDRGGFRVGAQVLIPDTIATPARPVGTGRFSRPVPRPNVSPEPALYTIQRGDTLSSIAAAHYGKSTAWRTIYTANRKKIPDPNRLTEGVAILLPASGIASGYGVSRE